LASSLLGSNLCAYGTGPSLQVGDRTPSRTRGEWPTPPRWHAACDYFSQAGPGGLSNEEGDVGMYSILYIIGAIVVIIVVLRLLGLY
jgi:hypothetical protein